MKFVRQNSTVELPRYSLYAVFFNSIMQLQYKNDLSQMPDIPRHQQCRSFWGLTVPENKYIPMETASTP